MCLSVRSRLTAANYKTRQWQFLALFLLTADEFETLQGVVEGQPQRAVGQRAAGDRLHTFNFSAS